MTVYDLIQDTYKVKEIEIVLNDHNKNYEEGGCQHFTIKADGVKWFKGDEEFRDYDMKDYKVTFFEAKKRNSLYVTGFKPKVEA